MFSLANRLLTPGHLKGGAHHNSDLWDYRNSFLTKNRETRPEPSTLGVGWYLAYLFALVLFLFTPSISYAGTCPVMPTTDPGNDRMPELRAIENESCSRSDVIQKDTHHLCGVKEDQGTYHLLWVKRWVSCLFLSSVSLRV